MGSSPLPHVKTSFNYHPCNCSFTSLRYAASTCGSDDERAAAAVALAPVDPVPSPLAGAAIGVAVLSREVDPLPAPLARDLAEAAALALLHAVDPVPAPLAGAAVGVRVRRRLSTLISSSDSIALSTSPSGPAILKVNFPLKLIRRVSGFCPSQVGNLLGLHTLILKLI